MYSASAMAANAMIRAATGAAFPLFTDQMFRKLGVGWAGTVIAGVALLLAPSPFVFARYGARIRAKSEFAPCLVSFDSLFGCENGSKGSGRT
jgi:DHA1 family multidrug resistance protein-like MFS transporter